MKILFIGNVNSQMYLCGHAKWLKRSIPGTVHIDLFSTHLADNPVGEDLSVFDNIFYSYENNFFSKIPGFKRRILMKRNFLKIPSDYDIIQVHYVLPFLKNIAKYFPMKARKVVVSFWGSDFYKASAKELQTVDNQILPFANAVTLGNPEMMTHFRQHFFPKYQATELCYFGNDIIEKMQLFKGTKKTDSKASLGFMADKITVTVGYNSSPNNQHIKVIKSLAGLSNTLAGQVEVILPLTYGGTAEYVNEIEKLMLNSGLTFKLLKTFLTADEIFHLRNATDIFIQVPVSDALSGSLREHLYCENVVIAGSWLPYYVLTQNAIHFHQINTIDAVAGKLEEIVTNLTDEVHKTHNNAEKTYQISSWNVVVHPWIKLYNSLLKN